MGVFKKLFSYAEDRRGYMVAALLLSAVATILSFVPYYFLWEMLHEITGSADYAKISKLSYLIFATTILYMVTYIVALMCSHLFAFRLETNMKKKGLNALLDGSFSFFDMNSSGKTRKIIDDNSGNTHTIVAHILPDSVNAVLFPICLLVLSFMVSKYVGALIVAAVIAASICFKFMYSDPDMMKEYMGALDDINSETVEYVRGIQVIKIFNMVIESFERLYKSIIRYSEVVNAECQMCRRPFVVFQVCMLSLSALIVPVAYVAMPKSPQASETISLVVFFASFSGLLMSAFMKVMFFSKNFEMANDAINKLESLFDEMDKNKLAHGDVSEMTSHDIEFAGVTFRYEEGVDVLTDFSLELESGKKYALVGSSGSGKSTIAKLISGFYPVSSGELRIGGVDISKYKRETLEHEIAFVFQNAKLFKTSIYENVQIGRPDASREEVIKALDLAMCGSILDKFEAREDTIIGAKGVHLSGGETQRIAIARAILKDAPIIILDEASAASDPENEYEMQQAFSKLMEGKTVIMIAHRLSSIRNVDEILVVEDGKVTERGAHDELMKKDSKYKKLHNLYNQANEWRLS
nr:ABC transporter ATP-binding protein [uncultured Mogibacterium sp.]